MSEDWRGTLWTLLITFCILIIRCTGTFCSPCINALNAELNSICYLLALLGAYHFLHVSRIRAKIRNKFLNILCNSLFKIYNNISLYINIQGDQKVSVHLMITIQKVTSYVQGVPRQSSDIYWHAELCSRRPCSVQHGPHSECILWWPSSNHKLCGDCNHWVHIDFLITLYNGINNYDDKACLKIKNLKVFPFPYGSVKRGFL